MPDFVKPGAAIIFMKIGLHAQESIEDIIKRKQDEFAAAGRIFWGYGGNTCHPTRMVQPFAREVAQQRSEVHLVMQKMKSSHFAEPELAKEYSDDGLSWYPVPNGIHVRGSRYAMVIGGLTEEEFDLNLHSAMVAVGPSRGQRGDAYIRGRVDKGCFALVNPESENQGGAVERVHLDIYATVMEPYAVLLR